MKKICNSKQIEIPEDKELFLNFLLNNKVAPESSACVPERYADFYLNRPNLLIELKRIKETELSHKIPFGRFFGSISPFRQGSDSYNSIDNGLEDANQKAKKAEDNCKYKDSIFILLFYVEGGRFDLPLHQFLSGLQGKGFIKYSFSLKKDGFLNEKRKRYYLKREEVMGERLLSIDYVGIVKTNRDFNKWKIKLIEKPNYKGMAIPTQGNNFAKFIEIYKPSFI